MRKLALLLALASCDKPQQTDSTVYQLGRSIDRLSDRVSSLEDRRIKDEYYDDAIVRPSEKSFGVVQGDIGRFTFSFVDVKPYADGSRVTLEVGNLTSAIVMQLSAEVQWGAANEKGLLDYDTARTEKRTLPGKFYPGKWTRITIDLAGRPPEKLGFIRFSKVTSPAISMPIAD